VEGLPWPAITAAGGGWALFGVTAFMLVRGFLRDDLVSRRRLEDVEHDKQEWRTESRLKDAQLAEKDKQLEHLKQVGNTVEQLVRGLQKEMRP
jgi:chromosome condensin MukBEF ATPase and DNA-binding subunit MukB